MPSFNQVLNEIYFPNKNELSEQEIYYNYINSHTTLDKCEYISNIFSPDTLLKGKDFSLFHHYRFSPPCYHTHRFMEIVFILKGEFRNIVEGIEIVMHEGDVCIIPPNTYHSFDIVSTDSNTRINSAAVNIFIQADAVPQYFKKFGENISPFSKFLKNIYSEAFFQKYAYFKSINHTLSLKIIELLSYEIILSKIQKTEYNKNTVISLFEAFISEITNPKRYSLSLASDLNKSSTNDIIHYILSNYRTITLEQVAKHFNYSVSYTSKLIKKRTGQGFTVFVIGHKLNEVCKLLANTDYSISKAVTACGFNNMDYFYRLFKKEIGLTPSEYRNSKTNAASH